MRPLRRAAGSALLCAVLGCASYEANKDVSLLQTAGFRVVAANTPEKIQALRTLAPEKITAVVRDGTTYYVYPDPEGCRCLRVGNEDQYALYERLAAGRNVKRLDTVRATTDSDALKGYGPW